MAIQATGAVPNITNAYERTYEAFWILRTHPNHFIGASILISIFSISGFNLPKSYVMAWRLREPHWIGEPLAESDGLQWRSAC